MKRLTAMLLFVLATPPAHPLLAGEQAPGNESIHQADLKADLYFLASDAMRGRLTDTPENRLAAEFIKARFERLGLTPAGPNGSFFQPFNLVTTTLGDDNRLAISSTHGDAERRLRLGQDYYPLRFSASGRARGPLVFAGFGITAPALSHDDYRGGSVDGKIVLVLDHEPGERDPDSPFDGLVTSEAARTLRKALYAQARGAAGILVVSDVHNHPGPRNFEASAGRYWPAARRRIDRYTLATWMDRVRIPAAQIAPASADAILLDAGRTLADLAKAAEAAGGIGPQPIPGPVVELTTSVARHVVPDRNVVAMVEGADPDAAGELVIVCAHYDHNGADDTRIFNGADDDGSGIVSLLEIAEAYAGAAAHGITPRRSVLFAAWNSEERGLLGAWAYTEAPRVPLDRTVAVLNMDMVGRNEEVPVGGGRRFRGLDVQTAESNRNAINVLGYTYSPDLRTEIEEANATIGLDVRMRYDNNPSNLLRRSDHWPFLQRGVPAVFFHTGLHPDYHTPDDRPDRINYAKMEKIARLVHQVSWHLAQSRTRPRYVTRTR